MKEILLLAHISGGTLALHIAVPVCSSSILEESSNTCPILVGGGEEGGCDKIIKMGRNSLLQFIDSMSLLVMFAPFLIKTCPGDVCHLDITNGMSVPQ